MQDTWFSLCQCQFKYSIVSSRDRKLATSANEPYIYENDDINWVSSKQPPKQLLHVNLEKSPILLSNSTRNPKSGVAYKKKKTCTRNERVI